MYNILIIDRCVKRLVTTILAQKMHIPSCLITYIERRIAEKIDTDSIIDKFYDMKKRRVHFR
jgi:hypothetical protein